MPDIEVLLRERANSKRNVTRVTNEIRRILAEEEQVSDLVKRVETLKGFFKAFIAKHEEYCRAAPVPDMDVNDKYFAEQQDRYIEVLNAVKSFKLQTAIKSDIDVKTETFYREQPPEFINLPKVELQEFDGNPLHYHEFMCSFDLNVHTVYVQIKHCVLCHCLNKYCVTQLVQAMILNWQGSFNIRLVWQRKLL
ncbi:Uncharacterised protein r2_g1805 [Pycnogonum litorale]